MAPALLFASAIPVQSSKEQRSRLMFCLFSKNTLERLMSAVFQISKYSIFSSERALSSVYLFRRSAKNVHVCCVLALLQTQNHHLVCHGTASSPRLCATHPIFQSFGDRTDVLSCFQNLHVGGLMSAAFLVLFNMFEISTLNSLLVVCSKTTAKRLMFAASLLVLKTFKITSPIAPWRRLFLCNIWPPKFDDLKIMFCLFLETVFGYGNICCVLALLETLKMISREAPTPLFL